MVSDDEVKMRSEKYSQLEVAVQDLLCELRIGPDDLERMADGLSPSSYPSTNKIQLSQYVSFKLYKSLYSESYPKIEEKEKTK